MKGEETSLGLSTVFRSGGFAGPVRRTRTGRGTDLSHIFLSLTGAEEPAERLWFEFVDVVGVGTALRSIRPCRIK